MNEPQRLFVFQAEDLCFFQRSTFRRTGGRVKYDDFLD